MRNQLENWMKVTDKCGLPGKFKAGIYQNGVLSTKAVMALIGISDASYKSGNLRATYQRSLRRWLGVPESFSSVGLYSFGTKVQLPLNSDTEEFKVTKVSHIIMPRDSQYEKVNEAGRNILR